MEFSDKLSGMTLMRIGPPFKRGYYLQYSISDVRLSFDSIQALHNSQEGCFLIERCGGFEKGLCVGLCKLHREYRRFVSFGLTPSLSLYMYVILV